MARASFYGSKYKLFCATALAGLLVVGCAPQYNVDEQLNMVAAPALWQSPNMEKVRSELRWLDNDNIQDLPEIVMQALENNPDLRVSANRLRTAMAQQQIASGSRNITGNISASASRNGDFQSGTSDNQGFSLRGSLSWEADIWGRLASDNAAAQQNVLAVKNDLEFARMSLATRTAQRWFDVTESVMQNELLELNLEKLLQAQDLVQSRYSRGLVDVLDVLQLNTNLATARSNLANQRQTVTQRMRLLETLIGSYPSGIVERDANLPDLDGTISMGIPADMLAARPDISAAKSRVLEAKYDLNVAKKALYPSLSISGSTTASGDDLADIVDIDRLLWSVVGNLVQPILDGGRRRQQVVINEVNLDSSLASYLRVILNAYEEAENALTAEVTLAEQEQYLSIAVETALDSEEKALEQYAKGLTDILSLINVQRSRISSQQSLLRVKHRRLLNRADLHLALGGQNIENYINQMADAAQAAGNQESL
ncbi:MAG: efflux transporter outer membrane subunit [Emcibacteraceae bacterium]|nr:efflux transporter outer membrane subunit [Emcibacteraceae bacterium]